MNCFNVLMILLFSAISIFAITQKKYRPFDRKFLAELNKKWFEWTFVCLIIAVGAFLRLYLLGEIPSGFNQDEASIGYDSWAIANYGMDRNGDVFPVYPVAWGAGHGPFYLYVAAVFVKLFGLTPFVYRLPNALMGIATLVIFYLLLKRLWGRKAGYIGLRLLVFTPWHVMLSRWGLDANPLPFVLLLGVYWLVIAIDTGKTRWYILAAAVLSVSLYVYGSALVAVPVMLLILLPYLIYHKKLKWMQLLYAGITFVVIAIPLALFYIINLFELPEISTSFFTIPRLTVLRSESAFLEYDEAFWGNVLDNIHTLIEILTTGASENLWNAVPKYYTVFLFTFPITLLGAVQSFRRAATLKKFSYDTIFCAWFLGSVVLTLILAQININRLSVMIIPQIYFLVMGIVFIAQRFRRIFAVIGTAILTAGLMFCSYYFTEFPKDVSEKFMDGLGEALQYADEQESETMYVTTRGVNGGGVMALFYLQTPPQEFVDTVVYYNNNAEFRHILRYGKYVFSLPEDVTSQEYWDDIFVVHRNELSQFSEEDYIITRFENYAVVQHRGTV